MGERGRLLMLPDYIHLFQGIAAVRNDKAIEKVIIPFERKVEATPGERASHRFNMGICLVDRLALAPLDSVWHHIKSGDDLIGNETTKISDHLLPCKLQLLGAGTSLPMEFFHLRVIGHSKKSPSMNLCFRGFTKLLPHTRRLSALMDIASVNGL
jgi:hypothetical protein